MCVTRPLGSVCAFVWDYYGSVVLFSVLDVSCGLSLLNRGTDSPSLPSGLLDLRPLPHGPGQRGGAPQGPGERVRPPVGRPVPTYAGGTGLELGAADGGLETLPGPPPVAVPTGEEESEGETREEVVCLPTLGCCQRF